MKTNAQVKLKCTKLLVMISFALSILNYFSVKNDFGELYPFFHWKLYTQPLGNTAMVKDYRVYGIYGNDTIRLKNKGYKFLNQDDYYYFISNEAKKLISNNFPKQELKQRLKSFGLLLDKNCTEFLLVEESFSPLFINSTPKKYQTKILLKTK